ncbi:MAG: hypothetical protein ISN64_00955 [Rickettsia sp.]|nr:hypothetical protein [Rickettsia sp.]
MEYKLLVKPVIILIIIIVFLYLVLKIIQKHPALKNTYINKKKNLSLEQIFYIDSNTKMVSINSEKFRKDYLILVQKNNMILLDSKNHEKKENF